MYKKLNEADRLLGQLPPRDASKNRNVEPEPAFRYKEIRRVTLPNGIKAVRLPDGRMMAKSLDKKQGKPAWITVRG